MDFQRFFRFVGIGFAVLAGLSWAGPAPAALPNFGVIPSPPGKAAPAFTLPDLKGASVRLEDFKGKVVVLNFWASWCGPCVEEIPSLGKLHDLYKDKDWVLIGVSVDSSKSAMQDAVKRFNIPFLVLHDEEGKVAPRYGARALPTTFFINKAGELSGMVQGGRDWTGAASRAWMDHLLESGASPASPTGKKPERAQSEPLLSAPPAEIEASLTVTTPEKEVWMNHPFSLLVEIRWKDELGRSGFEAPRGQWGEGVRFLSDMTQASREGEINILRTEMRLVVEKGPEGLQSLGPFEAKYHDAFGRSGILKAAAATVTAKNLYKQIIWPAVGIFLSTACAVFAFVMLRRRRAAKKVAPVAESKTDRLARLQALERSGDAVQFYEGLLEISEGALAEHLRSRLEAVRYGGYRPASTELEEDFRRAKSVMNMEERN